VGLAKETAVGSKDVLRYAQDLSSLAHTCPAIYQEHIAVRTVLVADDNALVRALVAATVAFDNSRVLEAATGSEALDTVYREKPDLVILDHQMPPPSGVEVCRQIKSDSRLAGIRIIVMTADSTIEPLARAAGADRFLNKPFNSARLLHTLAQLTEVGSRSQSA
jgi:CheY-like chemotaxis protein